MSKSRILSVANMYFKTIRENKIIAKVSESTVNLAITYLLTNFYIKLIVKIIALLLSITTYSNILENQKIDFLKLVLHKH